MVLHGATQAVWDGLRSARGSDWVPAAVAGDDLVFWHATLGVVTTLSYLVLSSPYVVLEMLRLPVFERMRIQPGKGRTRAKALRDVVEAVWITFFASVVFLVPYMGLLLLLTDGAPMFSHGAAVPSTGRLLASLAFYQFAEDFTFYFSHRLLHSSPLWYRYHKRHHAEHAPWAAVAIHADLPEVLLGNYVPAFSGFVALMLAGQRPHLSGVVVWVFLRLTYTFHVHSGYDFPWSPERLPLVGQLYAGPLHHDEHHRVTTGNFASTLTWLDKAFGTDIGHSGGKGRGAAAKKAA